jgi:multidrug transporter EmrE-like cation transporter
MKERAAIMMLIYVSFIIIFESLAQNSFKTCYANGDTTDFALGVIFYGVVGYFLIKMYEYETMGIVNIIWSSLSIVSIMLIGHYFWGEKLTVNDIIGSIMVFIGLIFIMLDDK